MLRPTVSVLGPAGLARDAIEAVLDTAGFPVVPPAQLHQDTGDVHAVVLSDDADDLWEQARSLPAPVVLVDGGPSAPPDVAHAVLRGADAVVHLDAGAAQLVDAVMVVAGGGTLLTPAEAREVARTARSWMTETVTEITLTPRESDILASIERGESVKQTARTLGIAIKTVENLQSRLFRKLGARNRAQAIAKAHDLRLVTDAC